jgi:hypothetical protein
MWKYRLNQLRIKAGWNGFSGVPSEPEYNVAWASRERYISCLKNKNA